jgi:hypothetical protein
VETLANSADPYAEFWKLAEPGSFAFIMALFQGSGNADGTFMGKL